MNDIAIKVDNVSKTFKIPHERTSSLKQSVVNVFKPKKYTILNAVNGVSFEVKKGEFLGIIGHNGCGKSTLLKMLAGIYKPTHGSVEVNGALSPFIELGVGFNPELSARDNIYLNGTILGMSKRKIESAFENILNFSGLHDFVDQKLKNYSSGMQVRLAFAIAIQAHADILLIDEVLAVGDVDFQAKCLSVFRELKKAGRTIVFVSHGMDILLEFCDRIILLDKGNIISTGKPRQVVNDYLSIIGEKESKGLIVEEAKNTKRWGDGSARIIDAWVEDSKGTKKKFFGEERFTFNIKVRFYKDVSRPVFGIIINDENDIPVFQSNTTWLKVPTDTYKMGEERIVSWEIDNYLNNGKYFVSPAVAYKDGSKFCDWRDKMVIFAVKKPINVEGFLNYKHKIEIK